MGLFSKKPDEKEVSLPKLPELPEIPRGDNISPNTLPKLENSEEPGEIHELPSFPKSEIGEKFSQNTIKNAINGKEEEEEQEVVLPTFPKNNFIENPAFEQSKESPPLIKSHVKEDTQISEPPISKTVSTPLVKEEAPVFIRIDKFEETVKIIRETKEKIEEIEELLSETKELKKKEEEELSLWEKEIQQMKVQIEKVDKDIFSKI